MSEHLATRGQAPAPLMSRFAERRRDLGIPQTIAARHLGTRQTAVSRWELGNASPKLAVAAAYAHLLGWRLVLHDGHQVLGKGMRIPSALTYLRRAYRLRQRDLAALLHVRQVTVAMWESRGCVHLDSVEMWAAGLGLHIGVEHLTGGLVLDHLPAATARRWAA